MSTTIAHEINDPLETIQNLLFIIKSTPAASEVTKLADQAMEEVQRVSAISRSTLSFFRQSVQPEPVDLLGCSESVKLLLRTKLAEQGTEVIVSSMGDCNVEAFGGETRQVLLNLVRNAVEASVGLGKAVQLELRGETGGVNVTVEDRGSGIDPALIPRLFQFGMSTKGQAGNGLGLWSVKHIVEKHGGTVNVVSTLGQGTTFKIFWPRKCACATQPL